jgi:hypothetical protein
VSDHELFKRATAELGLLRTEHDATLGMVLTITNHIPWDVPADAPNFIKGLRVAHPSFATTAYVDWALGKWEEQLHAAGLWQDMIIIFSGDHGARHRLYYDIYKDHVQENSVAHVVAGMSGGIIEESTGGKSVLVDEPISQMDVAAWIARLFSVRGSITGQAALGKPRGRPIATDTEDKIFFPVDNFSRPKYEVLTEPDPVLPEKQRLPVLYYREMMNWLMSLPPSREQPR